MAGEFGYLEDLGKGNVYMDQFGKHLVLKTIINSNCALIITLSVFASITLFDPIITLSSPIIPNLQIKKN